MAKNYLISLNLNNNELQNFVVHPLPSPPPQPRNALVYFNTVDEKLYVYIESILSWVDITGRIQSISTLTGAISIDNSDPNNPTINIADANGTTSGLLPPSFFSLLSSASVSANPDSLAMRDASGNMAVGTLTLGNVPSASTDAATKAYVDLMVSSSVNIIGELDASTNPDYPTAIIGDAYHVSVAGNVGGILGKTVEVGDTVLCILDTPSGSEAIVGDKWIVIQANLQQATETLSGYAKISTNTQALAGVDDTTIITPAKLKTVIDTTPHKVSAVIGDGSINTFIINHQLGTNNVLVQIFDTATNDNVQADININDINNITLHFTDIPGLNSYKVIIIG